MHIFVSVLFGLVAIQVAKLRDEAVELRESMHFQHREVWKTNHKTYMKCYIILSQGLILANACDQTGERGTGGPHEGADRAQRQDEGDREGTQRLDR